MTKIKRALLSVSDKTGLVEFAERLAKLGVEIISTGGTEKILTEAGIKVRSVSNVTGFPEMLGGRVKTLHPKVHGGILAVREDPEHQSQVAKHGIELIDLVVVNLYPFERTVADPGVSLEEAIENIDIGGPTMLRSAAKNFHSVGIVTDPGDYPLVAEELEKEGCLSEETRMRLCVKAFRMTANYDAAIDKFLSERLLKEKVLHLSFGEGEELRYGENWHQKANFYLKRKVTESCIATGRQLHGKEMSYNNYLDADAALEAVKGLVGTPAIAVIKHTNPCGYATGKTLGDAFQAGWEGDPISAMGSIIACTVPVDLASAEFLKGKFVEIIIAPAYQEEALEFLKSKSKDIRIIEVTSLDKGEEERFRYRHIVGGILEQEKDSQLWGKWDTVTKKPFPEDKRGLAEFAWKAAKYTKSNAIVLAREYEPGFYQVIGMGAGQPNRVDSLRKLATTKAKENFELWYRTSQIDTTWEGYFQKQMSEVAMASDAFFPFDDIIITASEYNIRYIIQPGGSVRDSEIIQRADQLGIAMVFTGTRHFLH